MIFHASIPLHMLCLLLVTPLYLFTQETPDQLLKACSVLRVCRGLPGLTPPYAPQEFARSPVDALITLDWNNLSVNSLQTGILHLISLTRCTPQEYLMYILYKKFTR